MSLSFEEKVAQLQKELDNVTQELDSQDKCLPISVIAAVIAPFAIALILYFVNPKFTQKKSGNKYVRSGGKIFQYTIIFTVIIWAVLFGIVYGCGSASSLMCLVKN